MNKKKAVGPQLAQFFNGPRFTLKLPNSKGATMPATAKKSMARKPATKANRKHKGGHRKHKRRNPTKALAAVANPQTIVKYRTRKAPAVKANRKRRRHSRRNGRTGILTRMNPFGGKGIGGLQPGDLIGGGVGILLDGGVKLFVPAGWFGIAIRLGAAVAMAKYLPKSLGPAAGLTAGAMVVKDSADRLFNATALFQGTVTRFIPLAATPATGMSGFGRAGMNPMGVNFGNRIPAVNGSYLRY